MARTSTPLLATLTAILSAATACSSSDPLPPPPALGSSATSAQIELARTAADGTGLAIPVEGAYVTHVRPLPIGADAAGFTIQSQRSGPALFVAVDPATLYPLPVVVGDQVDLTITAMATVSGRREATAVTGYARLDWDAPVALLQQELSSAGDLVSAVSGYESELVTLTGELRTDFGGSGNGFVAAGLNTAAISNDPLLLFRLPTVLRDELDLALGCRVTLHGVPLWRSDATVLATAWAAADLDVGACPAPRVESAVALSSTLVRVRFDRVLDPSSVHADGSQFSFDGGLLATAAAASGAEVTITTTGQGAGTGYTVTVASSVRDLYDSPVDPAFDQGAFAGYVPPAQLRLAEVNASVTGGADLVELEVVAAGTMFGVVVQSGVGTPVVLATLPGVEVSAGDLVVVHLSPAAGVLTETTARDGCADAACYAGAWDVAGGAAGIVDSSRVLAVKTALGIIQDAVPFTDGNTTGGIGAFLADLQDLQSLGLWLPADCGGDACAVDSDPTALEISVSWLGMGTAVTGASVRRVSATDTDSAADWTLGASSFGAAN